MEDNEIVKLYLERDERSIPETAAKYGGYCKSIAMNILQSHEDAEECVQDTYLHTWNSIPPHRPKLLSTFLGKIVRNLSFNRYNAMHAKKRGGHETALILDELCDIVSDRRTPEDELDESELTKAIDEFLYSISEHKRYMFVRRYWYGDSTSVIAKSCKSTEGAVYTELSRLRKALRTHLTERGYDI